MQEDATFLVAAGSWITHISLFFSALLVNGEA
jgi:hypothetical protein